MAPRPFDYLILSFEPSADSLGAKLIETLLLQNPHLHIAAASGPKMRKLPITTIFAMEKLQVMGFVDVVKALPKILIYFFFLKKWILKHRPKKVVFIDYPDFNLRLEKALRKKKFAGKLIHYVSPTVWAWRKKRIYTMEKNLDHLLTIFPFEKQHFQKTKLPVTYVGHPLVDAISSKNVPRDHLLALFPGSRKEEIEKNLPFQLSIAQALLQEDPTLQVAVSMASLDKQECIERLAGKTPLLFFPPQKTHALMEKAKLAIATSGTVNLELALHKTPTLVNYKISKFDLFLARKVFQISLPFYSIVNLVAEEEVFPEFFGPNLQKEPFLKAAKQLLWDVKAQEKCLIGCEKVKKILNAKEASIEAIIDEV